MSLFWNVTQILFSKSTFVVILWFHFSKRLNDHSCSQKEITLDVKTHLSLVF